MEDQTEENDSYSRRIGRKMNLLTIKNLTKAYTDKVLFDGFDFSLEDG